MGPWLWTFSQFTTENTEIYLNHRLSILTVSHSMVNVQCIHTVYSIHIICPLTPIVCNDPLFFQLKSIANCESKQNWPTTNHTGLRFVNYKASLVPATNDPKANGFMYLCWYDFFYFSFFISCNVSKNGFQWRRVREYTQSVFARVPYVLK